MFHSSHDAASAGGVSLLLHELSAFFLPGRCAVCSRPVYDSSGSVCAPCAAALAPLPANSCGVCGGQVLDGVCPDCSDRALYYERNLSVYSYRGEVRVLIAALKRGTNPEVARFFGRQAMSAFSQLPAPDCITFVPVSAARRRERGYNQAELIASELSRLSGVPVSDLLSAGESGNQKTMHYNERFLNMIGRFNAHPGCSGRRILLVDDVFTTGSTINECARILKKKGAISVFSLTIARVDNKKVVIAAPSR